MTVHVKKATRSVSGVKATRFVNGVSYNIMRELSKGELIEWVENSIADGDEVEVRDGDKVVFRMARHGCFIVRSAG